MFMTTVVFLQQTRAPSICDFCCCSFCLVIFGVDIQCKNHMFVVMSTAALQWNRWSGPMFDSRSLQMSTWGPKAVPWGPKERVQRKGPKGKSPKEEDHIHWWISINEFIDGPSMNSLMDVHQWIPMDFQFFEIQFFEKTIEKPFKNHEKQWKSWENHVLTDRSLFCWLAERPPKSETAGETRVETFPASPVPPHGPTRRRPLDDKPLP